MTNLRDPTLHDQEVGVVDVKLYALEQGLDGMLLGLVAVEEIFRNVRERNLQHTSHHSEG